jgi:zinc protease
MTALHLRPVSSALATVLIAIGLPAVAQGQANGRESTAASVASFALTDLMPVDPDVRLGALPNGLRYYVRDNPRPASQVEMRLVVTAGSALEDPDQLGLAHFVEHMEFEGTTRFPGQGVTRFLSSLGLGIGPDANAQTSYDDTQYSLRLPTDAPDVVERGLDVLEGWAHGATFDPAAIERQRGIVLAEWRQQLGAGARTGDELRRVQLEGSRYAERPPIGDPAVIERAGREQLVRFYRDWYRPNMMAVIVVGDIDEDSVVRAIEARFAGLTNPTPERPRPAFDVAEQPGTRFAIVTDPETTGTVVGLGNLRPARPQNTVGGYRQIMLDQLFGDMLTARLDELAQMENPPFFRVSASRFLFQTPRTRDQALIEALVPNDGVPQGLDALVTELERVERFGFTDTELARAKRARLLSYERMVTESPDRESASRANEYTRNFLQDEALPTIWQELAFHRRFIPEITLANVNALRAEWFPEDNRLVIVSAPDADGLALPDMAELEAVVARASARDLEPYEDLLAGDMLMAAPPSPGTIVATTPRPGTDITEWTLSNGATVVLLPTTLRQDQILFRAFAPGGTSLASDADLVPARMADDVIAAGGVDGFSAAALDRILTGRAVAATPFIGELGQGMVGGSTPQDLEVMFQLLHLRFTRPRADPAAFAALAAQYRGLLANRLASPEVVFDQTLDAALSGNHPRRQPDTPATVDQWDLARSLDFYRARFADASGFTFVFVGSLTPEMMRPLVEAYLASLPATHAGERWTDLGIVPPRGVVERTVQRGIAPKSEVAIVFTGPFTYDDEHLLAIRAMTTVLQGRLFDTLRQELGDTYSITVVPRTVKLPRPEYAIRIDWTCDPSRTAALVRRVFDEIAFVRRSYLSQEQTGRLQALLLRDLQQDVQNNGYLLNEIAQRYENDDAANVATVFDWRQRIASLSSSAIHDAAETYLDPDNYVQVTLMPEIR